MPQNSLKHHSYSLLCNPVTCAPVSGVSFTSYLLICFQGLIKWQLRQLLLVSLRTQSFLTVKHRASVLVLCRPVPAAGMGKAVGTCTKQADLKTNQYPQPLPTYLMQKQGKKMTVH